MQHISRMHPKFALRPVHVQKYGTSNLRELRIGEKKRTRMCGTMLNMMAALPNVGGANEARKLCNSFLCPLLQSLANAYCMSVDTCLKFQRYSPKKLCDGVQMATFCIPYYQQPACSTFQTRIPNLH